MKIIEHIFLQNCISPFNTALMVSGRKQPTLVMKGPYQTVVSSSFLVIAIFKVLRIDGSDSSSYKMYTKSFMLRAYSEKLAYGKIRHYRVPM